MIHVIRFLHIFGYFITRVAQCPPVLTSTLEWLPALKPRDSTGNYNSSRLLCLTEGGVLLRSGSNLRFCWRTPCPGLPAWCRTAWPGFAMGSWKKLLPWVWSLLWRGGSHHRLMGRSLFATDRKARLYITAPFSVGDFQETKYAH